MFENIEQLEREVQEFRKNILASSELVASFERMITQIKEQTKAFEAASGNLQGSVKTHTEDLQKQIAVCLQKQADLIAEQSRNVEAASKVMTDAIGQQMAAVAAQSKSNVETFERSSKALSEQIDRMSASVEQRMESCFESQAQRMVTQSEGFERATKGLESVIGQKAEEFSGRVDSTLEAQIEKLTAANQAQIRIALDTMEKTNREFAAKCDEASKSFVAIQEDLNARYEQVLTKLEAANVSETVRLSKSIIKSINVKFGILLTGVAASIVLAVLAYIK